MTLFSWNSKFSIDVDVIDNQHKKLFELINNLHSLVKSGIQGKEITQRLDALIDYTSYHFVEEEKYMQEVGYIRLDQHKLAHQNLREQALKFRENIISGDGNMEEFINFLYQWLTKHIMEQDRKIGKFVEQKAISSFRD